METVQSLVLALTLLLGLLPSRVRGLLRGLRWLRDLGLAYSPWMETVHCLLSALVARRLLP